MKKNFFKRGMSALLAIVMCLSAFIGIGSTTAFAAESVTDEVVMFSFPREGDSNFGADWGHGELKFMNGWFNGSTKKITVYTIGSWWWTAFIWAAVAALTVCGIALYNKFADKNTRSVDEFIGRGNKSNSYDW